MLVAPEDAVWVARAASFLASRGLAVAHLRQLAFVSLLVRTAGVGALLVDARLAGSAGERQLEHIRARNQGVRVLVVQGDLSVAELEAFFPPVV